MISRQTKKKPPHGVRDHGDSHSGFLIEEKEIHRLHPQAKNVDFCCKNAESDKKCNMAMAFDWLKLKFYHQISVYR